MPSHKPIKTYERKTRSQVSNTSKSVDAFNALFAQNLTKRLKSRRKAKIKLKELPPRLEEYVTDDSLKVSPNNTFDKIAKGKTFNKVKVGSFQKIVSSDSEASKSNLGQVSVSNHSSIMTRQRKRSKIAAEISNPSVTEKNSTLDRPVTSSCLSIEKENKSNFLSYSSLTYIKLPKITENVVNNNPERSYEPIFSDTFRERQAIHSSTPCVTAPTTKLITDPISPITKSDSSNSTHLIEKSYDQIRKWDSQFPNLETPKKPKYFCKNYSFCQDWKLNCEPKVFLKPTDIIQTRSKGKKSEDLEDFKGFNQEEQDSSSFESNFINEWLSELADAAKERSLQKLGKRIQKKSLNVKSKKPTKTKLEVSPTISRPDTRLKGTRSRKKSTTSPKRLTKGSSQSKKSEIIPPKRVSKSSLKKSDIFSPPLLKVGARVRKGLSDVSPTSRSPLQNKSDTFSPPPLRGVSTRRKKGLSGISSSSKKSLRTPLQKKSNIFSSPLLKGRTRVKNSGISPSPLKKSSRSPLRKKSVVVSPISSSHVSTTPRKSVKCFEAPKRSLRNSKITTGRRNGEKSRPQSPTLLRKSPRFSRATRRITNESSKTNSDLEILEKTRDTSLIDIKPRSRKCVNITEDILSEKEMSYSGSFDFSSNSSSEDVPKKSLTVNLKDFDDFTRNYFSKVPDLSVISLRSDESFSKNDERHKNQKSLDFLITPRGKSTPNKNNTSKIIILDDVTLGQTPEIFRKCQDVWHDHSYSNSPVPETLKKQLSDIIESSIISHNSIQKINYKKIPKPVIKLKPGKSYRRSLSLLRKSTVIVDGNCQPGCICVKCLFRSKFNSTLDRRSSMIVPVVNNSLNGSVLENYARQSAGYVQQQEEKYINNLDDSIRSLSLDSRSSLTPNLIVTAKDVVLRRCGQTDVLPFEKCYPRSTLQHCQKIGEGVYGEVFLYRNQNGGTSVMKVIPIEGDLIVNGEKQKKFEEILSEIVIAMELSNLRNDKKNTTTSFSQVQNVKCVQGNYPDRLLDLWELYDETRGSENDSPQMFPKNQQYIVLELANGGEALESYVFNNAQQAYAMFKQTACALAVAENELKFEHRDLHWGNILVNTVDKTKVLGFHLNGKEIEVETCGIEATIIDFTLSRIEFDGVVIFNDLSLDNELFAAQGDYQFEIYRLMQKANGNMWQEFTPYTNILWLHYILDKAVSLALRYKNPKSKIHREYLTKLKKIKDEILSFSSVVEFVKNTFI